MEPLWIQKESRVFKTVKTSSSLRTTIPAQIAEFLKIAPGDNVEWTVRIQDAKIVVFVRRSNNSEIL
jgi:bifunctional DNA-binding transcriptional regulator/antitoxin component of YhaV-PrlF toxin-antitoxin module